MGITHENSTIFYENSTIFYENSTEGRIKTKIHKSEFYKAHYIRKDDNYSKT